MRQVRRRRRAGLVGADVFALFATPLAWTCGLGEGRGVSVDAHAPLYSASTKPRLRRD
jgi:hypothetical protein